MADGPQFWGNVAQWASAAATGVGLAFTAFALFKRHSDQRTLEFDRGYRKRRKYLQDFWPTVNSEWAKYRNKENNLPEDIGRFVATVGPPRRPSVARDWPKKEGRNLSPHEQLIWAFVTLLYPAKDGLDEPVWKHSCVKPEEKAKLFHEARGQLAWFWNTEALAVRRRHLQSHHFDDRELLFLLCWLELAVTQWTQADGPGKQRLFTLAERAFRKWEPAA
jgi:hypothetical protein